MCSLPGLHLFSFWPLKITWKKICLFISLLFSFYYSNDLKQHHPATKTTPLLIPSSSGFPKQNKCKFSASSSSSSTLTFNSLSKKPFSHTSFLSSSKHKYINPNAKQSFSSHPTSINQFDRTKSSAAQSSSSSSVISLKHKFVRSSSPHPPPPPTSFLMSKFVYRKGASTTPTNPQQAGSAHNTPIPEQQIYKRPTTNIQKKTKVIKKYSVINVPNNHKVLSKPEHPVVTSKYHYTKTHSKSYHGGTGSNTRSRHFLSHSNRKWANGHSKYPRIPIVRNRFTLIKKRPHVLVC